MVLKSIGVNTCLDVMKSVYVDLQLHRYIIIYILLLFNQICLDITVPNQSANGCCIWHMNSVNLSQLKCLYK